MAALRAVFFLCCLKLAAFTDPTDCVMELECRECLPDNMPLVRSPAAVGGRVLARHGQRVTLACAGGNFLAYPLRGTVDASCERGRYRVDHDRQLRHLLELGCQENVFEDVLHEVDGCGAPLQGRSYQTQQSNGTRHLAALCFDADRGVARSALAAPPRAELRTRPHADRLAPLTLLGNFNHMFDSRTRHDAETLYSNDESMTRRLHEQLKHERVSFAEQSLTSAKLLSELYFEPQDARVADFVSNRVPVWRSVARGNLRHAQRDVARLLHAGKHVHVIAGTHGVATLRAAGRRELYLRAGGRFPVPKYIWTVVVDEKRRRALAITVLNDPFVAVSEIKESVFCESACGSAAWLRDLTRHRNYEAPVYGLAFCCSLQNFTSVVTEMPKNVADNVDEYGLLTEAPRDLDDHPL